MKPALFIFLFSLFSSLTILAQIPTNPKKIDQPLRPEESLEYISEDLEKIAKSVEQLNKSIIKTYAGMLNNKGLVLTDNQQKILVSFEILLRAERRLATLQKTKIELAEKLANIKAKIGDLNLASRRESIDRNIALRGTTNAQELRDERRRNLSSQKLGLVQVVSEIETTQAQNASELLETIRLVQNLRRTLFPAIYRELPKLDSNVNY